MRKVLARNVIKAFDKWTTENQDKSPAWERFLPEIVGHLKKVDGEFSDDFLTFCKEKIEKILELRHQPPKADAQSHNLGSNKRSRPEDAQAQSQKRRKTQ